MSTVDTPRVAIVLTGGTMQSVGADRLDQAWYFENNERLSDKELLARIPELSALADIESVPLSNRSSTAHSDHDWLTLQREVRELSDRQDLRGIVIAHGTNTLEETAYFLQLTLDTEMPVVVTGAMRPPSALGSDAEMNLLDAVRVAASDEARGHGVIVAMNRSLYAAREVTKSATDGLGAFTAYYTGPLGHIGSDHVVRFHHRPHRYDHEPPRFSLAEHTSLPRVDVLMSHLGADGALPAAALAAGARGLVSAATGAGRITPAEEAAYRSARESGVAVVIASRTGAGPVLRNPTAIADGFVAAGDLPAWKARILVSLGLTRTNNPDDLQRMFDVY